MICASVAGTDCPGLLGSGFLATDAMLMSPPALQACTQTHSTTQHSTQDAACELITVGWWLLQLRLLQLLLLETACSYCFTSSPSTR